MQRSTNSASNEAESVTSPLRGNHHQVKNFFMHTLFFSHFITKISDFESFAEHLVGLCRCSEINSIKDDKAAVKILKAFALKVVELHPSWKEHVFLYVNNFIENSGVSVEADEFRFL